MSHKIEKIKPNIEALKKYIDLPECEVEEGKIWYPSDDFLIFAHDIIIECYGYWSGFELGIEPYHHIINETEEVEGIYRKAAILIKGIATIRIFQDGHHRTAFEVTKTFLEMNGAEFNEKDDLKIIKFMKGIRKFDIEQIEGWLKNGTL
jgi:death-on-curing family protein